MNIERATRPAAGGRIELVRIRAHGEAYDGGIACRNYSSGLERIGSVVTHMYSATRTRAGI